MSFPMTDAMEVDDGESWHPSAASTVDQDSGDHGHALVGAGFKHALGTALQTADDELESSKAHAEATSATAGVEDADNLNKEAGKKSPQTSKLLKRRPQLSQPVTATPATVGQQPPSTTKQNILSQGDRPHANTHVYPQMTINDHATTRDKNNMVVEMETPEMERRDSDEDVPINLVSGSREEAVNLTKMGPTPLLSAKLRLKKQRLEAVAKNTEVLASSDHSALHRLAEAAERKQVRAVTFPLFVL